MSVMEDGRPNLDVVDEAFGNHSDLYTDVLQVQPNAGSEQIQEAYFDRRNELFQLLADIDAECGDSSIDQDSITESHRRHAERQMDAVVCAVRILGEPDLRLQYDDLRTERLKHSPNRVSPERSIRRQRGDQLNTSRDSSHLNTSRDSTQSDTASECSSRFSGLGLYTNDSNGRVRRNQDANDDDDGQPPAIPKRKQQPQTTSAVHNDNKHVNVSRPPSQQPQQQQQSRSANSPQRAQGSRSKRKNTPLVPQTPDDDETNDGSTTVVSYDDEDATIYTFDEDISVSESVLVASKKPLGLVDRIRTEIIDVLDDTSRSLEQIFGAFTLQEDDIKAVMGRIDKAKRQVARTHIIYPSSTALVAVKEAPLPVTVSSRKSPSKSKSKSSRGKSKR